MLKDPALHIGPRVHAYAGSLKRKVCQPVRHPENAHHHDEKIWGNMLYVFLAYPSRYRSYYYDGETGMYYLSARYFDPIWMRFIKPDNIAVLDVQEDLYDKNLYTLLSFMIRKGIFGICL